MSTPHTERMMKLAESVLGFKTDMPGPVGTAINYATLVTLSGLRRDLAAIKSELSGIRRDLAEARSAGPNGSIKSEKQRAAEDRVGCRLEDFFSARSTDTVSQLADQLGVSRSTAHAWRLALAPNGAEEEEDLPPPIGVEMSTVSGDIVPEFDPEYLDPVPEDADLSAEVDDFEEAEGVPEIRILAGEWLTNP